LLHGKQVSKTFIVSPSAISLDGMHGILIRSEVSSELLRRDISVKGDNRSDRIKFLEYIQHLGLNVQLSSTFYLYVTLADFGYIV
jgi:hypothetical protein